MSFSRSRRRLAGLVAVTALAVSGLTACSTETAETSSEQPTSSTQAAAFTLTDITGRNISLPAAPERILLGEGRSVFATGILDKSNPLDKVVGIGTDLKDNVPDYMAQLEQTNPEVKDLPEVGGFMKGDVTVENLLSLKPDIILLSLDEYQASEKTGLIESMDKAGLTYAVTDFRAKPLENTTRSMEIFGTVFGKEKEAAAFNKDWQETVDLVKGRSAKLKDEDKPTAFVWRAAGLSDCCQTWNDSNISQLVNVAGGKNIGDAVIEGESGAMTPEKVISDNPDEIFATGGEWSAKRNKEGNPVGYAALGYRISDEDAQVSVNNLPKGQKGFDTLSAVKDGQLHGLWHQFYNSPFNYLALLQIAAWLHPEDYSDIDVPAEWMKAQEKYSPVSGEGVFFSTSTPAGE
ncbi:ABC transporter substrate-binding protein [Corynebacterium pyruviciproducens]|uniref:ABC transporter substrate-binding protein n=1 Tax=Corynebacterium pyruviciproducens TaxID=598660 RepID=UPI0023F30845|nr:ABC transporter substrate-binding protein [Corynebacterium pyruviciproducens]